MFKVFFLNWKSKFGGSGDTNTSAFPEAQQAEAVVKNTPLEYKKVATHARNQRRYIQLIMYEQCALNKSQKLIA